MKYSGLSEKRKLAIKHEMVLDIDDQDNIVYLNTREIIPDEVIYNFFEFSNV